MKNIDERFWNASVEELKKGFIYDKENQTYICLICGSKFEKGIIYKEECMLLEAEKAIEKHIEKTHISVFDFLIGMDKKYTGLTDHQRELMNMFRMGYSDKEIVSELGGGSTSTIRNHRFSLREKEKQAKVFLALMGLMSKSESKKEKLVDIHRTATMIDERYSITEEEQEKITQQYFEATGKLTKFPSKEKRKIVVLRNIIKSFKQDVKYTEKQVNEILKGIYDDYVTIRRYLIEYGFLDRTKDCSLYWIKQ